MSKYPIMIIGCGDIGLRVAKLHLHEGDSVAALARSSASEQRLRLKGITPVTGDLDQPSSLQTLSTRSALLYYFAPPPGEANIDPRMKALLDSIQPGEGPTKIVYISTSGVYGDCHGGWVTEQSPVNPRTARAKARLAAETLLLKWGRQTATPIVILRVGGIYGPGRLPIEHIEEGLPVLWIAESPYTNRIHADDLARICMAAALHGEADIYNVSDGEPSTMTDYFNAVADLLNLPRPPQITMAEAQWKLSPAMLSYLTESRRMDNRRMIEELGVTLLYPNLQAGLAASI